MYGYSLSLPAVCFGMDGYDATGVPEHPKIRGRGIKVMPRKPIAWRGMVDMTRSKSNVSHSQVHRVLCHPHLLHQ